MGLQGSGSLSCSLRALPTPFPFTRGGLHPAALVLPLPTPLIPLVLEEMAAKCGIAWKEHLSAILSPARLWEQGRDCHLGFF